MLKKNSNVKLKNANSLYIITKIILSFLDKRRH